MRLPLSSSTLRNNPWQSLLVLLTANVLLIRLAIGYAYVHSRPLRETQGRRQ